MYDSGRWLHSPDAERIGTRQVASGFKAFMPNREFDVTTRRNPDGPGVVVEPREIPGFAASRDKLHVKVTFEDIGADVIFAASEPVAARLRKRGLYERYKVNLVPGRDREFKVAKPPGPTNYERRLMFESSSGYYSGYLRVGRLPLWLWTSEGA